MRFQPYAFKLNPIFCPDQSEHHETPAQTHIGHLEK